MQVKAAPLFQAYAEAYMTRYKLRKIGANTMVGYRSYLTNHLYPNFGDLPIDSITVDRVQDFMLLEADNGKAKASINRIMQLLTQIMDSAVEDELILKNPCKSKRLYNPSEKQCKVLPYSPGTYKQMERLLPLLPTDTDKLYLGLSMYAPSSSGWKSAIRRISCCVISYLSSATFCRRKASYHAVLSGASAPGRFLDKEENAGI